MRMQLAALLAIAVLLVVTCRGGGIGSGIIGLEEHKRESTYEQIRSIERDGRAASESRIAHFYDGFLTAHLQARIDKYLRTGDGGRANALFRVVRGKHYDECLRNAKRLSIEALAYGMYNVQTLDSLAKNEADNLEP